MESQDSDDKTRSHALLANGTTIAQYRIIEKIGAGGMGEVYLAEDTKLKRRVALKFLPAHLTEVEEIKQRFMREAQAVAKLNHPNIVTIHDVSEYLGRPYFVMEHIEGQSLHHFAHEEPVPLETVIDYAIQICQGIGEAHRAGIVHRDIKAANIVIDSRGRARLLDFGLASIAGDDKLTRTGSTLGTVSYMSPEQVSGREIDQRSDLFSLGIVLYELIAGRTPFRRDNEGATLRAIMQDIPEPLSRYKSEVPERLQQIVEKLLEKDREMRCQTAEDVIADLKRLQYDSQQSVMHRPQPKRGSRSGLMIGVAAAVVVVLAAATAWFFLGKGAAPQAEIDSRTSMIAVLPFENLGNPDDEYFADGMTEEVTSRLSGIDGLGVISRTSSMQYKRTEKTIAQIGKELGVTYVLEGTVRWAKEGGRARVRITPRLIRVADNRQVWGDNYERELMQVFAVQEDIATQIVDQLGLTLLDSDREVLASRPTESSEAYDYYLKGIAGVRREIRTIMDLKATAALLDSAVMIDPSFALAWAARSRAYSDLSFSSHAKEDENTARSSFERALTLQPNLSAGHLAAGIYYNLVETDYDRALDEFNRAKSEMHNDADLLSEIGLVQMRQGRFDESKENHARAAELDPLNPVVHANRANCLRFTRSFDEAEKAVDRAIALDPSRAEWYIQKMDIYASLYGDLERIKEVVAEAADKISPHEMFAMVGGLFNRPGSAVDTLVIGSHTLVIDSLTEQYRRNSRDKVDAETYYTSLALVYRDMAQDARSTAYLDSARTILETHLKDNPDDPHRLSALGVVMAYQGHCDQAEEFASGGEELLSIDKCHW